MHKILINAATTQHRWVFPNP